MKFSFFKDRDTVLATYRTQRRNNGPTEKGNMVRIVEDFPPRVTKQRTALYPLLKKSISENKWAFYRYDKLVVDGVTYSYDFEAKCPIQTSD